MQTNDVKEYIVSWLKNYCLEAGANGFVVGISGGIDSAVTSKLAALTNLPVLCVEMPIHQNQNQVTRGVTHINQLMDGHPEVRKMLAELTPMFDAFVELMPHIDDEEKKNLSMANARARIRMTTLYYLAQINNMLVVGTGNKVEDFGIGFFTKYGDGGVDLSPIADLTKTEVYELAAHLGIDQSIIDAPPTDGLWGDDRTDEDQIGASYKELEWAMTFDGDRESLTGRNAEVMKIYDSFHRANKHKMQPIPVCLIPKEFH